MQRFVPSRCYESDGNNVAFISVPGNLGNWDKMAIMASFQAHQLYSHTCMHGWVDDSHGHLLLLLLIYVQGGVSRCIFAHWRSGQEELVRS